MSVWSTCQQWEDLWTFLTRMTATQASWAPAAPSPTSRSPAATWLQSFADRLRIFGRLVTHFSSSWILRTEMETGFSTTCWFKLIQPDLDVGRNCVTKSIVVKVAILRIALETLRVAERFLENFTLAQNELPKAINWETWISANFQLII